MRYTDIDLGKGFNPWGSHRKLKADDTRSMIEEEELMLQLVSQQEMITPWNLYKLMIDPELSDVEREAARSKLMALTVRLTREGKLVRVRTPHTIADLGLKTKVRRVCSYLVLGPSYVPPLPDLQADQADLGRPLRDVDCAGGLASQRRSFPESGSRRARR